MEYLIFVPFLLALCYIFYMDYTWRRDLKKKRAKDAEWREKIAKWKEDTYGDN